MSLINNDTVRLVDVDGEPLDNGAGELQVVLNASSSVNIGDVDLEFNGTAASVGADNTDSGTLRVTLATNDLPIAIANNHLSNIHTSITDITKAEDDGHSSGDKGIHILGVRDESLGSVNPSDDGDYSSLLTNEYGALWVSLDILSIATLMRIGDTESENSHRGLNMLAVRNDTLANLVSDDHDYTSLQVNAAGALYVDASDHAQPVTLHADDGTGINETSNALNVCIQGGIGAVGSHGVSVGVFGFPALAETKDFDGSALPVSVGVAEGEYARIASSLYGVQYVMLVNEDGSATGKVGHDITGMVSDYDADVGVSAEKIHTAADVAIKRIDIQANPANTGVIFVGDSGVAGNGSGGGIRLQPGDFYSLDIDNTSHVYVAAEVADENVNYIYYT